MVRRSATSSAMRSAPWNRRSHAALVAWSRRALGVPPAAAGFFVPVASVSPRLEEGEGGGGGDSSYTARQTGWRPSSACWCRSGVCFVWERRRDVRDPTPSMDEMHSFR